LSPEIISNCAGAPFYLAKRYAFDLTLAMDEASINTSARQAAFLAQVGHESGGLVFMEEIWGPTRAQLRYEPPSTLAVRLGNTQKGDGKRFKGRGPIQVTGRDNYKRCGVALGLDLETYPQLLSESLHGFRASAWFWKSNRLNELADTGDFVALTKRINGGTNGLADRQSRWAMAKNVLGVFA
jgi:putative chitinase